MEEDYNILELRRDLTFMRLGFAINRSNSSSSSERNTPRLDSVTIGEGAAIGQRPMTSLRDIDEAGQFVLTREFTARRLAGIEEKRILRSALRVVRNQNGRVAELDDDDEGQN